MLGALSPRGIRLSFEFICVWATDIITSIMAVSSWDFIGINTLVRALFTRPSRSVNLPVLFLVSVAAKPSCLSHTVLLEKKIYAVARYALEPGQRSRYGECYRVEGPGFESRQGQEIFSSLKGPDLLWCPPSLLFNGYLGSSPEVKRPGREVKSLTSI
jgi:hypothetical protein